MKKTWGIVLTLIVVSSIAAAQKIRPADDPDVASSLNLLESWIEARMEYKNDPGLAVGIIYDQELIWAKGFGWSDTEKKIAATPRTIYRIGSITKLFTATAVMQLRDREKLRLDDPIVKYIPGFEIQSRYPEAPPITVRHLLTHTSGLPREAAFPYWTDHIFPSRDEIIEGLRGQETTFPSETKYKYSNLALALAGEVVTAASGEPYEQFIEKNILEPLGMTDTSVNLTAGRKDRLAAGCSRRLADGKRTVMPYTDAKGIAPAANMSSTVEDLARFISLQFRNDPPGGPQILKPSTLREMHRVHWLLPGWRAGRGLGFSVRRFGDKTLVGHAGWVAGYQTQIGFVPEDKIGAVVLTSADDGQPGTILEQALTVVTPAILRAVRPEAAPGKPDPAWSLYTGKYTDPTVWESEVLVVEGKLVLYNHNYPPEENARGSLIELAPAGKHAFRMTGENGDGELVIFEIGTSGKVERVKVGENYIYPKG